MNSIICNFQTFQQDNGLYYTNLYQFATDIQHPHKISSNPSKHTKLYNKINLMIRCHHLKLTQATPPQFLLTSTQSYFISFISGITHFKSTSQHQQFIKFMENDQIPQGHFLFTSQGVTCGHPDKLCDIISDSVLDACLTVDPNAKVACETAAKGNLVMVFGEVSLKGDINTEQIVRKAIKEVGYDSIDVGMDYKTATVIVALDQQSVEIAQSVHVNKAPQQIGAGDQGLMIGYAADQTQELMPLSVSFCNALVRRLEECRYQKILPWLRPDGKVQVTVEYKRTGTVIEPVRVHTILISTQHSEAITNEDLRAELTKQIINEVIPSKWMINTRLVLNPSDKFTIGGPAADSGLTGRKIIADTYGGWGGHGGGAFSGKDPSKVDRSAAYAARWIAKNLVANKFCRRAMVQVAYSIGIAKPLSIFVDSYGTVAEGFSDEDLQNILKRNFDLRPGMIIKDLKLTRPIYRKSASGGHFGRNDSDFTWESIKDLSHEHKKKQ